ncbi:DUF881 domain-containing protein [Gracilibacillus alcaliphilus]|uniref:DUF881 domain-containing protein n=1 Tax=Gracilibacillus alcaliphilus TaxID=1401441 RepID=UPI001EF97FA5|nr:DUF881 domain-containing protein [Gracilibacillus alcaliphilus]MBM7678620.1 uncharacterized protein YlxW (UPF0749 family) [Gracilibacillus alcaliphilus]
MKRMRRSQFLYACVFLVLGFLLAFNYKFTSSSSPAQINKQTWQEDFNYKQQLNELEEQNKQLRSELNSIRQEIRTMEEELSQDTDMMKNLVQMKNNLQKLTGDFPIYGEGVIITLRDADYIPREDHANQYIVHDRHIHQVVNELFSAGAKAVAINGQRIYRNSYISCVGPVISVDGTPYPAPFVISAIGDQKILDTSLNLQNGVIDMLVQENIEVAIEKQSTIEM